MKHDQFFNPAASACDGKEAFLTWNAAQRTIKRKQAAARAHGDDIPQMVPYRCPWCRAVYVGGRTK